MAGEGYALAREELVRTLTSYSGVTTADGSSSKNTLIDSALTTVIKTSDNDFLTGKSILILSGDARWETSGITSFNSSTGEITVATPFSAQIVAGVSFRVLNVLPESVHISSGEVQIMGYDYLSGEYRLVAVNVSGQIEIKATVADIVTARVSGVVAVVSGEVHVMSGQVDVFLMSGEAVAKISGQTVALQSGTGPILAKVSGETVELASGTGPILARISGDVVKISGEAVRISGETVVAKVSGEAVKISGETVALQSGTGPILAKVSGETVELASGTGPILARISGDVVKISGEAVEISGEAVRISGETVVAKVSGEVVKISGETVIAKVSGEVVKISGETVSIETPTMVKTGLIQIVTHGSGGQVLYSGSVKSAVVKAVTDNSGMIAVGGSGDRPWYEDVCSGLGLVLDGGEAVSLDVDDFNRVYVVAEVSGDQVSFLGVN